MGISLVEVLVAILITSIGLLALLTLFPLGALEMVQAVQADRTGHIKRNAGATANTWDIRHDQLVTNAMLNPNNMTANPYIPNPGVGFIGPPALTARQAGAGTPQLTPSNPLSANAPSYPVLVDPNGYWANNLAGNPAWQDWVAGGPANSTDPTLVLPRRVSCEPLNPNSPTPSGLTMATDQLGRRQQLLRWTTLLDDMNFPRDVPYAGRPCPPNSINASVVDRTPRYSWAYMCQMPKATVTAPPVYVSVIVYAGRALEQSASGETAYKATYNFGNDPNVVQLRWNSAQDPPDVTVGGWIFDATMTSPPRISYFYRVVSINPDPQNPNTALLVELQPPYRTPGSPRDGVAVILANVIEAFDLQSF